ncbi:hypothetical protein COV15_01300 [Candidatus Woesearchaeota archaeon CG10_big_fil_rev_8_21_14_0_10_34_12]|nr:MAG: hypothetical protein COV15_01300 [Candidatus Woesearchaeota archaeon CG10_big_fil_rev_8_21_14_0_10_34_12]
MKLELMNKAVYLEEFEILAVADVHIGYEEALNKKGVFLPRSQFKEMKKEFEEIFKKLKKEKKKIKEIVILGDLKHEFGKISHQEWDETICLLDYFAEKAVKIVLIKGNHDNILEPIAHKRKLEIVDYYVLGDILFCHGHKNLKKYFGMKKIKKVFLGHEHPAVSLKEGRKSEVFKCFLVGKLMGKEVYFLPSFFPLTIGSDIVNSKNSYGLFNLAKFRVFIIGDRVYDFGVLEELRKNKVS